MLLYCGRLCQVKRLLNETRVNGLPYIRLDTSRCNDYNRFR